MPNRTSRKRSHCSNMLLAASYPMMGATFWLWRREAVSACIVSVLISSDVSHRLATSATLEIAERDRSGSR